MRLTGLYSDIQCSNYTHRNLIKSIKQIWEKNLISTFDVDRLLVGAP